MSEEGERVEISNNKKEELDYEAFREVVEKLISLIRKKYIKNKKVNEETVVVCIKGKHYCLPISAILNQALFCFRDPRLFIYISSSQEDQSKEGHLFYSEDPAKINEVKEKLAKGENVDLSQAARLVPISYSQRLPKESTETDEKPPLVIYTFNNPLEFFKRAQELTKNIPKGRGELNLWKDKVDQLIIEGTTPWLVCLANQENK